MKNSQRHSKVCIQIFLVCSVLASWHIKLTFWNHQVCCSNQVYLRCDLLLECWRCLDLLSNIEVIAIIVSASSPGHLSNWQEQRCLPPDQKHQLLAEVLNTELPLDRFAVKILVVCELRAKIFSIFAQFHEEYEDLEGSNGEKHFTQIGCILGGRVCYETRKSAQNNEDVGYRSV